MLLPPLRLHHLLRLLRRHRNHYLRPMVPQLVSHKQQVYHLRKVKKTKWLLLPQLQQTAVGPTLWCHRNLPTALLLLLQASAVAGAAAETR